MSRLNQSIQSKIILGFLFLTISIISLVYFILSNAEQSRRLNAERIQIHSLSDALTNIQRSNAVYLSNVARDYESYYRDVEVYYKMLMLDISAIDGKVNRILETRKVFTELSQEMLSSLNAASVIQFNQRVDETQGNWSLFKSELDIEFGDDKNEPRLEWGAEYIEKNAATMAKEFDLLVKEFDEISTKYSEVSDLLGKITVAIVIFFFLAFALFFFFNVINPIKNTQLAFQRVSEGDFGHQINSPRNDEIGLLIRSFNQMSARSNSVLSILSNLQTVNSFNEAVEILYAESKDYIGGDLVILVKRNLSKNGYTFSNVAPAKDFKNLYRVNTMIENDSQQEYMRKIVVHGTAIRADNISDYYQKNPDAVVMKTLLNRYPLKSIILQPLDYEPYGAFLIFASYRENQFSSQHNELINHLMPFVNHKFQSIDKVNDTIVNGKAESDDALT